MGGSSVPNIPTANTGATNAAITGGIQGMGAYTPANQAIYFNQLNNPYTMQAQAGAATSGAAQTAQGQANLSNAGILQSVPQQLNPAIAQTLSTAYDPQRALYETERQASTDFTNVDLASRGLGSSPWGTGIASESDQTFNTNWLQSQLGREQSGAGTIAQLLGAGGGAAQTGAGLGQQGAQQLLSGASQPYLTATGINTNLAQTLPFLTGIQQQQLTDYLAQYGAENQQNQTAVQAGMANNQYATGIGQGIGSGLAGLGSLGLTGLKLGAFG